ncbi:hypothetical protein [Mesorhizobium sp. WSM2561]|uniref:hypothetical protein n=1 Tax=Mesorhizobium sp. WSM2561 TaxID=1040985 RepID=UPI0004B27F20|nr:hypothetical protein [Mesorhizobium sp. WSM2561]
MTGKIAGEVGQCQSSSYPAMPIVRSGRAGFLLREDVLGESADLGAAAVSLPLII